MQPNYPIHTPSILQVDLAVIGSGAGNIVVDAALADNRSVALIEKGYWGGTCLNRGCIPTKILLTPADKIREWPHLQTIGLDAGAPPVINWPALAARTKKKVLENRSGVADYYSHFPNCRLIHGEARFSGPKTLTVHLESGETCRISAETIVIAAGGRSRIPQFEGIEQIDPLTSESFFDDRFPDRLYRSVTLIGGADIGVEFAHMFAAYGCQVTLIQHNVRLVPKQDADISAHLLKQFRRLGIRVILNQDTVRAEMAGGLKRVYYRDRTTAETGCVDSEAVFVSAGITPYTNILNLDIAGVETDERGWIRTNEYLQTTAPGIYALGDINGRAQLRHKANYEAEILAWNLYQKDLHEKARAARYDVIPSATFTHPQIGRVGLTEQQALDQGYTVRVGIHPYSAVIKAYALGYEPGGEDDGFVKLIVDAQTDRLLGLHIIGPEAAILVQGVAWLMNAGDQPDGVINADIQDRQCAGWRKGDRELYIDPTALSALTHGITIHPSLAEVVGWTPGTLKP